VSDAKRVVLSDTVLVEEARRQRTAGLKPTAYEELVRRYQDRLYNLLLNLVHHPQEAEDVSQEAFARAFEKLTQFRGSSSFYTWLVRIALNELNNRRRRGTAHPTVSYGTAFGEDVEAPVTSRDLGPAEEAERSELAVRVREALRQLPEDYRHAVILVDMDELPYEEVAELLGIPVGTVKSRVHRGRKMLRDLLENLIEKTRPSAAAWERQRS
jgi:RNA polymerase sigma-70 factor (ECF subfamily)